MTRCGTNVGKSHLNEKCNSLIVSELYWLFRDSVGIRESAVFYSGILCFTGSFSVG